MTFSLPKAVNNLNISLGLNYLLATDNFFGVRENVFYMGSEVHKKCLQADTGV